MSDVKVPRLAESISEAVLAEWLQPDGASVRVDQPVVTLETDKAAVEIAATENGVLRHAKKVGDRVVVGDVIARVEPGAAPARESGTPRAGAAPAAPPGPAPPASTPASQRSAPAATATPPAPAEAPRSPARPEPELEPHLSPAVRRLVEEHGLEPSTIEPSGKGGRVLKEDVLRHLERAGGRTTPAPAAAVASAPAPAPATVPAAAPAPSRVPEPPRPSRSDFVAGEDERVVPMSRIRQRIAERLVRAQQTAAILTTFNEIDMGAVMELRARHKEEFEKRHGVKLGFMSLFTRACVLGLDEIPELNAEIRGTDIVYHRHVHMGIAVSTERGLVVPVVREAERRSFADVEREIARLAERARTGTLTLDELSGGTFTISNGGIYGSLFSTPILNPPQSGILGMHKIQKRPVELKDQVVIRPMMYVALSYDHRIVDGEQAVTFLVRVKERLEDPERMMLDV